MREVFVSFSSFPKEEILEKGQAAYIDAVIESGATGVEIRQELLRSKNDLEIIAKKLDRTNLKVYYATRQSLWDEHGVWNGFEVENALFEAELLRAERVKFVLGGYCIQTCDVKEIKELQQCFITPWIVENDRTEMGGSPLRLKNFLDRCHEQHICMETAFDIGNVCFIDGDVSLALHTLESYISYIHLKGIQRDETGVSIVSIEADECTGWKEVLQLLPNVPVGCDFPITNIEQLRHYVTVLQDEQLIGRS